MGKAPHPTLVLVRRTLLFLGGVLLAAALCAAFTLFYYSVFHRSLGTMRLSFCVAAAMVVMGLLLRASRMAREVEHARHVVKVWVAVMCFMIVFTAFVTVADEGVGSDKVRLLNTTDESVYVKVMEMAVGNPLSAQRKTVLQEALRLVAANAHLLSDEVYVARLEPGDHGEFALPKSGGAHAFAVVMRGSAATRGESVHVQIFDRDGFLDVSRITKAGGSLRLSGAEEVGPVMSP